MGIIKLYIYESSKPPPVIHSILNIEIFVLVLTWINKYFWYATRISLEIHRTALYGL